MIRNKKLINTALLTIGDGPISHAALTSLEEYTELKSIVFSRRERRIRRRNVIRQFGLWYVLQKVITKVAYRFSKFRSVFLRATEARTCLIWRAKNDEEMIAGLLKQQGVEVIFISGFHYILSERFRRQFRYCINIHPSLLPAYRGPEPITWALLEGKDTFGITLHHIDNGIDTGDIICQKQATKPFLSVLVLIEYALAKNIPALIIDTVMQIEQHKVQRYKQEYGSYRPAPTLTNRRLFRAD